MPSKYSDERTPFSIAWQWIFDGVSASATMQLMGWLQSLLN